MESRIDRYVTRRLRPQAGPIELVRQKIYIVPSKTGLIFGVLLFILFILAMNYNNSLVFALTFFFAAIYLVSMTHVHRNIQGMEISSLPVADVFCWEQAEFKLQLKNPSAVEKNAFQLRLAETDDLSHVVDIAPRSTTVAAIPLDTSSRGVIELPKFAISTTFPGGLFYAWSWIHISQRCIVYPSPAAKAPAPPTSSKESGSVASRKGLEDIAGVREYQQGDSLKRVAWKTLAKGQGLKSLESESPAESHIILDWNATQGDTESRLSILCRWVIDCDELGYTYGLQIPGTNLPVNKGQNHRRDCLRALSRFGHD